MDDKWDHGGRLGRLSPFSRFGQLSGWARWPVEPVEPVDREHSSSYKAPFGGVLGIE